MGGHGALTLGLKHPELYQSISAFSPICNPMNVPWGQKAFSGYLGDDKEIWKQYDATELVCSCALTPLFYLFQTMRRLWQPSLTTYCHLTPSNESCSQLTGGAYGVTGEGLQWTSTGCPDICGHQG